MIRAIFKSVLAPLMNEFVAFKKSQGFGYESAAATLWYLDRFLVLEGHGRPLLDAGVLERYAASMRHLAPRTQYNRLAAARALTRWLRRLEPAGAVIDAIPVKLASPPRPYPYTREEVAAIIQAARHMGGRRGTIRPLCHATLVGLLHATGLRIGEALALNIGDIDLAQERLVVRRGKLGKARNIPLSPSTAAALGRYLDARSGFKPHGRSAAFFINNKGGRLSYSSAAKEFKLLLRSRGIGAAAPREPRLHDLRHAYACECLRKWFDEGSDVNAKLPVLSTAMGHVGIHGTQLYLHATDQLLRVASDLFHNTFKNNTQGAPR